MVDIKTIDTKSGKTAGSVSGSDRIFKAPLRLDLLNEYVIMQRRAARSGTASTLTRAEVSGTGKKPFKQKGTGHARQGTLRGPHQYHGGVAFGPKPREYYSALNRKMKKEAVRVALSQKTFENKLLVTDKFEIESGKTKDALNALKKMNITSALFIGDVSESTLRAVRNLKSVKVLKVGATNVKDILSYEWLILSKAAFEWCEKNLSAPERKKEKAA